MFQIKYKLKNLGSNIFLCTIADQYDLAMTFCRAQEFYESAFKEIRGKNFNITYFQKIYAKRKGDGVFTYPKDWAGFNLPSTSIRNMPQFSDVNTYDNCFNEVVEKIENKVNNEQYYLIGCEPDDEETINHEIAHALYFLDKSYKKDMDSITKSIESKTLINIKNTLFDTGYSKEVIFDEIQAYLSNDIYMLTDYMKRSERKYIEKLSKEYKQVFSKKVIELKIKT